MGLTQEARAWQALGDATRRRIFERLARRRLAVFELARELPVSRPAVSQHLKVLMRAGLVTAARQGRRRLYGVEPKGVAMMRRYLDRLWEDALVSFKAFAENEESDKEKHDA